MSSVVRTVVMWLIALAVPAQGMAGVVMPLCVPAQHAGMPADSHHAGIPAGMHHAGDGAPQAHAEPSHAAPSDACHSAHDMLKCCSASCSMAMLMAPGGAAAVQARPPVPLHPVALHYRGVTPDGLERPPRPLLA